MKPLVFGRADGPPAVVKLDGAYRPAPIPPGWQPPPPPMQTVQVIEPTAGWWRANGAFGSRFQGRPPTLEGDIIPLTEQLNLPGPPAPWWFHWFRYDRQIQNEIVNFGNWELRARLIYGVGGAQNIIETDLMQGQQFGLVCNSVSVQLRTYRPLTNSPYSVAANANVVAGCMFGKGGAGAGALPVTWTTPQTEVQPGVDLQLRFPLPDFARSICFHTTQTVAAGLNTHVLTFNGPAGPIKEVVLGGLYSALTQEKGIAIPGGTNQVEMFVGAAANAGVVASLQFFLEL